MIYWTVTIETVSIAHCALLIGGELVRTFGRMFLHVPYIFLFLYNIYRSTVFLVQVVKVEKFILRFIFRKYFF